MAEALTRFPSNVQIGWTPVPTARLLQRKCAACGTHTPGGESCTNCADERKGIKLQKKLSIGASNDPLEAEADRVADQVLARSPSPGVAHAPLGIQRHSSQASPEADIAPESVHRTLSGSGAPLESGLRQDMEGRFGHDFSSVRVHSDGAAAQSARDVNASAYTVGNDIVFGAGQYVPGSNAGQRLLAHELAHVVQQGGGGETLDGQVMRAPTKEAKRKPGLGGGTLPYREATELLNCIKIMGDQNSEYCREKALGEKPVVKLSAAGQALADELSLIIAGAEWKEIRKRVYPLESAPGIKRAKDRRAGLSPDMTGLGKLKSLDVFASRVRKLQGDWGSFADADARVKELDKIAGDQLQDADVPKFLVTQKQVMEAKGSFGPFDWIFRIQEQLVDAPTLPNTVAGDLANVTLHECRHAEQHFLAARFSAGNGKVDPATLSTEQSIPEAIASEAIRLKFDAKTNKDTKNLGKKMFKAMVTDGTKNQQISNKDGWEEMKIIRAEAVTALNNLYDGEWEGTIKAAHAGLAKLKAQIKTVEALYTKYRDIPYEADAHEVGDAAEVAFEQKP